jgi:uncharacterized membrane protein
MKNYLRAYLYSFGIMTAIDFVWLAYIAPGFYKKHIGFILADEPNLAVAALFYVILVAGVTIFVVQPSWESKKSTLRTALLGALFGFVTYATYDLTNQATVKGWPAIVTIVDLLWGSVLTAAVSVVTVKLLKKVRA